MSKPYVSTVFAHFSPDNKVDQACLNNLKGLKEISDEIVFISTSNLPSEEQTKLKPYCNAIQCRENSGLDFGSYQLGLTFIDTVQTDHLILANDSVYGPIYPLQETLDKAICSNADVYGITLSHEKQPHLQSYFLIFNKNVFTSPIFKQFWQNLTLEHNKQNIIMNYEIGLSQTLLNHNFKLDALYQTKHTTLYKISVFIKNTQPGYKLLRLKKLIYKYVTNKDLGFNPMHVLVHKLVKEHRVPFVKKELILKNTLKLKISSKLSKIIQEVS